MEAPVPLCRPQPSSSRRHASAVRPLVARRATRMKPAYEPKPPWRPSSRNRIPEPGVQPVVAKAIERDAVARRIGSMIVIAAVTTTGCSAQAHSRTSRVTSTGTAGRPGVVNPRDVTPRPAPTPARETLTSADSGATVTTRVGHRISVTLGDLPGVKWYRPAANGHLLRLTSATGGFPTSKPMRASYLALAPGTAEITATGDLACRRPPTPCERPSPIWQVRVIIRR